MPGGLASWLGDDEGATKAKLPKRPRLPSRAAAAPVIDVEAASPGATAAGGRKTNRLRALAEKGAWDPFSSKGTREDASQDAFDLLRKGPAASKPPAAPTASTPSPPAWREGSRPPASSWDPFGAPLADGKENRVNAFSKLLAAPASQQHGAQRRSSSGGSGKKTKLNNSSGGGGGGSPEADAVTRFCECPVCGKRVIIELCSKHLDAECSRLKMDEAPPVPPRDGPGTAEFLSSATLASASLAPAVSENPAPLQQPAASIPSLKSPVGGGEGKRSDTDDPAALPSKPAVAALRTIDNPGRPGKALSCSASAEAEASDKGAARNPLTSAAATAATKSTAARRRKASSGAPPSLRSGRKGAAGATAAADEKAMTECPVCGQSVKADLCSWHLDHECAGVNPVPAAASSVCDGKSTGGGSGSKREAGEEEGGGGSEEAARKKDAGSEATGGLNALAAELTCPICLCVFEDVHSLPCSHRFCRDCIMGCFKSSKRQECPLCKIPAWKRDLTRDVSLQNIILAYRRMAT